jgi:hypothetical protein
MKSAKEILYILYLLSGPALVVISAIALKQISIAKKQIIIAKDSIKTTSRRETAVFTAKQCEVFGNEIITFYCDNVFGLCNQRKLKLFIMPSEESNIFDVKYTKWLKDNSVHFKENKDITENILDLLNHLEAFAIYFMHKICDIDIAYLPVASTYVDIVEKISPFICISRNAESPNSYTNLLALYKIWKTNITKEKLKRKHDILSKQMKETLEQASCLKEVSIKPIGLDSE